MCRVLRVSQQGYYCFLRRPDKRERDQQLLEQIYACLREEPENANYGVRRIIWWLRLHCGYTHGDHMLRIKYLEILRGCTAATPMETGASTGSAGIIT